MPLTVDTILLVVCAILLATLVIGSFIPKRGGDTHITLDPGFNDAMDQLRQASKHYVDISAVVEMVRQLEASPDALALIKSYPETVRAAAWLHYINELGAALQKAQTELAQIYDRSQENFYPISKALKITNAQQQVDELRKKLHDAVAASGTSNRRTV